MISGTKLGPYEIQTLLGKGGMGEVYRALDPRMGREVATRFPEIDSASDLTAKSAQWRR